MKMITAIIQPFMLSKLTHALERIDEFPGMTVVDVQGFGREKAQHVRHVHDRAEDIVDFVKKVRVEIVARDEMVEAILATIVDATHTGNPGDGKIFVLPTEAAVRIRTGERGDGAV